MATKRPKTPVPAHDRYETIRTRQPDWLDAYNRVHERQKEYLDSVGKMRQSLIQQEHDNMMFAINRLKKMSFSGKYDVHTLREKEKEKIWGKRSDQSEESDPATWSTRKQRMRERQCSFYISPIHSRIKPANPNDVFNSQLSAVDGPPAENKADGCGGGRHRHGILVSHRSGRLHAGTRMARHGTDYEPIEVLDQRNKLNWDKTVRSHDISHEKNAAESSKKEKRRVAFRIPVAVVKEFITPEPDEELAYSDV
ncbi:uncharacterized protein LOC106160956 [Lingula anatina]|uniref:Uncharacterized protein LOC106160956 n=1 Tax=Lingula anatina TaxID=7574 RepID=A0A1S3I4N2_LINAN|nr:uncharacterized protein LOC106160956 [Lingula anatina]|eukprot:XP_013393225.1 uncharacterized protein LOC106160956 [Lingula anatina]